MLEAVRSGRGTGRRHDERGGTDEEGSTIGRAFEILQQQAHIVFIVASAGITSRMDARRTAQRVDADPRVVRDRG